MEKRGRTKIWHYLQIRQEKNALKMFFQEPEETIKHNDDDIEESDDDADDALLEDVINLARQTNPRYNFYQSVYYFYKKYILK